MVNMYVYIKTNKEIWDWNKIRENEVQRFATWTRDASIWQEISAGDIVIGHSTVIAHPKIKGKLTPLPRICAIGQIAQSRHYSEDPEFKCEVVGIKKLIDLPRPLLIKKDVPKNLLRTIKAFRPGYNRLTITDLTLKDYNALKELIIKKNPGIANKLEATERGELNEQNEHQIFY